MSAREKSIVWMNGCGIRHDRTINNDLKQRDTTRHIYAYRNTQHTSDRHFLTVLVIECNDWTEPSINQLKRLISPGSALLKNLKINEPVLEVFMHKLFLTLQAHVYRNF